MKGGRKNMFKMFLKEKWIDIFSPVNGEIISLEKLEGDNSAFNDMGKGIGIIPSDGKIAAPFDGEIASIYKRNHCIIVRNEDDIELIIHIGLDTNKLNGEGFVRHVELMDKVKKGDLLIEADIDKIKEKGFSIVTPVIVSHSNRIEEIEMSDGFLKRGEDVIMKVKMKKK